MSNAVRLAGVKTSTNRNKKKTTTHHRLTSS